jgi:serine/threonine protein kinase
MASDHTTFSFTYHNQIAGLTDTFDLSSLNLGLGEDGTSRNEYSSSSLNTLKTVDDLIISLDDLGVPGPLTLYAPFLEKLGEGAQFAVFHGSLLDGSTNCEFSTTIESVAIKLPLFNISAERRLDLTSAKSRRQVHDIYLEIMALRHPALESHRNIVELIGWGIEQAWNETPLLILELAIGDLHSFLANPDSEVTTDVTHQLCIDIGHGLDAIHDVGIVHGDLKPLNVLVFPNPSSKAPYIAKLADFGLSLGEIHSSSEDSVVISGISADWCAPEVVLGARLSPSGLIKADNFSYGLMLLSINCLNGRPPEGKDIDTATAIVESYSKLPASLSFLLEKALSALLQVDPMQRASSVKDIMIDSFEASNAWSVKPVTTMA